MPRKPINLEMEDELVPNIKYAETTKMLENYKRLALLHPNEFWAVYLLSAANIGIALADTRVWGRTGLDVDDDVKLEVDPADLKRHKQTREIGIKIVPPVDPSTVSTLEPEVDPYLEGMKRYKQKATVVFTPPLPPADPLYGHDKTLWPIEEEPELFPHIHAEPPAEPGEVQPLSDEELQARDLAPEQPTSSRRRAIAFDDDGESV